MTAADKPLVEESARDVPRVGAPVDILLSRPQPAGEAVRPATPASYAPVSELRESPAGPTNPRGGADVPEPDEHSNDDPGCDSCGTCLAHDGCADAANPVDEARGDCLECGACGDCVRDCAHQRALAAVRLPDVPAPRLGMGGRP